MDVSRVSPINVEQVSRPVPAPAAAGTGFGELLSNVVEQVNDKQLAAQDAIRDFAAGKIENVHDVMLAEVEAEISFKMLAQTRNKIVEAYKEIMRMDI